MSTSSAATPNPTPHGQPALIMRQRWLTVQSSFRPSVIPPVQCTHNERSWPLQARKVMSPPCK